MPAWHSPLTANTHTQLFCFAPCVYTHTHTHTSPSVMQLSADCVLPTPTHQFHPGMLSLLLPLLSPPQACPPPSPLSIKTGWPDHLLNDACDAVALAGCVLGGDLLDGTPVCLWGGTKPRRVCGGVGVWGEGGHSTEQPAKQHSQHRGSACVKYGGGRHKHTHTDTPPCAHTPLT